METEELTRIWKAHDNILDKSMKLNILCIETIQSQKSKSKIRPLLILRIIEVIVLIRIAIFLFSFLYDNLSSTGLVIAAAVPIIFLAYTIYLCLVQISTILQINYSDSVTVIQKKLISLQTHVLDYFRLSFLMIPFWLVYPIIGFKVLVNENILVGNLYNWWIAQIIFTIILIPLCLYAYREVTYKNINKRWVRFLIRNAGGKSVTKAIEFLKEMDEFKKD